MDSTSLSGMPCYASLLVFFSVCASIATAQHPHKSSGDRTIDAYFRSETRKLAEASLASVKTLDDWTSRRESYRQQLREMLGLDPLPERTPLEPVITGRLEHADFIVEKLHFQSRPQLYVTANLYLPKKLSGRAPAILYVCGHSPAKKEGVSYGNKTQYQHHGAWFARNGYVCLVLDTLQLGEIEGIHHGTYRENMWWWNARGYTPAGVEAWNAIRALDYLQSRAEVDGERIGMTGRSGGGATTWWVAALDERVKVAVPVAGITNLKNHVVDGCVEGHCDCMYVVNTYRWDYAQVAALVVPRPLLLSNTDHDSIFPLDGVMEVYGQVRRLYDLHGKPDHLGLHIAAGPHEDTQPLQVHAFQWFNQHLMGKTEPVDVVAQSFFEMEQLKVLDELPSNASNSRIHETFTVEAAAAQLPDSEAEWKALSSRWRRELREKCFGGWPEELNGEYSAPVLRAVFDAQADSVRLAAYDFESQPDITLRLYLILPADAPIEELETVVLQPLNDNDWTKIVAGMRVSFSSQFAMEPISEPDADEYARLRQSLVGGKQALVYFAPRGIGPTAWEPARETHIRRRFMLLGQTLDGMRVWDVRRAIHAVRAVKGLAKTPLWLEAEGNMAGVALYAALFEPSVAILELRDVPQSHQQGPDFLNVLRILDMRQTVAMVAENTRVQIGQGSARGWEYPLAVAEKLGWNERLTVHEPDKRD